MVPHMPQVVPLVVKELGADDAMNRQNAAYTAGVLVECGPEAMGPFLPQLLHALHPLFGPKEVGGAACGAARPAAARSQACAGARKRSSVPRGPARARGTCARNAQC